MTSATGETKSLTLVEISANGDRRELEAWYLEIRQLAKQYGLEVEFTLSKDKPERFQD